MFLAVKPWTHLKMFSSASDVVEAFKTIAPSARSSKDYSGSVGAIGEDIDWDGSIISGKRFTIFFWVGISLVCLALCVTVGWQSKNIALVQARPATSRSSSRSTHQSVSQTPRSSRERGKSIWSKVFSKGQDESKGWLAIRRFASRSRPQAGDVEMQPVQPLGSTLHQPRDWSDAVGNPLHAGATLHNDARHTRRLRRPEHLHTVRGGTMGWRAEAERQLLRDAWDRIEVRVAETYRVTPLQPAGLQPCADSPTIPAAVAQPNAGRLDDAPPPVYQLVRRASSPAPSMLEVPPPTYAEHTGDEVADLSDYQDPAHAAEEIRDVQGLPPYASPGPDIPASAFVLLPRHPAWL